MRFILLLVLACILQGCTSNAEKIGNWASTHQARDEVISTSSFPLLSITPSSFVSTRHERLSIFIEGDGRAWATSTQPSLDPSPRNYLMPSIAMNEEHPGIYLARPCQFVMNEECGVSVWTADRFGGRAIQSFHQAIDVLKRRHGTSSVELIGYSGGATIALILAADRDDVVQVQTIAGNVDPNAWVKHHKLTPLSHHADPLAAAQKLRDIKQRHFVGINDTVIPPALIYGFVSKISARCAEVIELPATHSTGWEPSIAKLLSQPVKCQGGGKN